MRDLALRSMARALICSGWGAAAGALAVLALARFLAVRRSRAGAAAALLAGYWCLQALSFSGVLPSVHWLLPQPSWSRFARAALISSGAAIAAAFAARRRGSLPGWALALLPAAILLVERASASFGVDDADTGRFIINAFALAHHGRAYLSQVWPRQFLPEMMLIEPGWWAIFRGLRTAGLPAGAAVLWANRIVSLAGAEAAVAATFWLGRELFDRQTAFFGAVLLACGAPLFDFYGCFYFKDVPFAAAAACALVFGYRAAVRGGTSEAALAAAAWLAALGIKIIGVFIAVPMLASFLLFRRERPLRAAALVFGIFLAGSAAVAAYAFHDWPLLALLRQLAHKFAFVTASHFVEPSVGFIGLEPDGDSRWFLLRHAAALTGWPIALAAVWGLIELARRRNRGGPEGRVRQAAFLLSYGGGLIAFLSIFRVQDERWVLSALPCLAVIAGYGLSRLRRVAGHAAAVALLAGLCAGSLFETSSYFAGHWVAEDFGRFDERVYQNATLRRWRALASAQGWSDGFLW